jgi:hypothetical protein
MTPRIETPEDIAAYEPLRDPALRRLMALKCSGASVVEAWRAVDEAIHPASRLSAVPLATRSLLLWRQCHEEALLLASGRRPAARAVPTTVEVRIDPAEDGFDRCGRAIDALVGALVGALLERPCGRWADLVVKIEFATMLLDFVPGGSNRLAELLRLADGLARRGRKPGGQAPCASAWPSAPAGIPYSYLLLS